MQAPVDRAARGLGGAPDLQVLNSAGRPVHKGDVVVLVTNGRFSKPALDFARSQPLHLVDRTMLGKWASGSRPLWELAGRATASSAPVCLTGSLTKEPWAGRRSPVAGRRYT
ncbi:restriction endonuclease [Streptomyces sp. PanSC19]|nr:restriction endonuclease [Streptomyces sp. PanSC19]